MINSIYISFQITGHANESQIMTASIAYMKRPEFLTRVLNDLYHLFRYENDKHPSVPKSLCVVLESMETHLTEKHIQISGRFDFIAYLTLPLFYYYGVDIDNFAGGRKKFLLKKITQLPK